MSKSLLSGLALRSGAILFSLSIALGACATVDAAQHGATTAASIKPSQAAWGYPIGAASPEPEQEPETHRAAEVSPPAPTTACRHEPAAPRVLTQTSC
jgi:hypothetical protein